MEILFPLDTVKCSLFFFIQSIWENSMGKNIWNTKVCNVRCGALRGCQKHLTESDAILTLPWVRRTRSKSQFTAFVSQCRMQKVSICRRIAWKPPLNAPQIKILLVMKNHIWRLCSTWYRSCCRVHNRQPDTHCRQHQTLLFKKRRIAWFSRLSYVYVLNVKGLFGLVRQKYQILMSFETWIDWSWIRWSCSSRTGITDLYFFPGYGKYWNTLKKEKLRLSVLKLQYLPSTTKEIIRRPS